MNTEIEHPAYVSYRTTLNVLLHLRKRLRDEYGVDITPEWEMRVINGEHDIPLPFSLSDLVAAQRERCAKIASDFTMKPDRQIHPDIPWNDMSENAKMVSHTTAQQIAGAILADTVGPEENASAQ